MTTRDKSRETRARRAANRQGLRLSKSPRRDPNAIDFGLYAVIDPRTGSAHNPMLIERFEHSWTLEQVESYLKNGNRPARASTPSGRKQDMRSHARRQP